MHILHLFQFGRGNIGGTLIRQVVRQHERLAERYGIRLEYIGLCGQGRAILRPKGIQEALMSNGDINALLERSPDSSAYDNASTLLDQVIRLGLPHTCIIDTTAADITLVHLACLRQGIPVVTANKKPVTDAFEKYEELQRRGRWEAMLYWYETTAGAGLPIIGTLRDLVITGDHVLEISGCLSGTLGYICSQLDTGRRFSQIVSEAKTLGYTEPDPREDLNGMDVARKALILAREIGYTLNLSDVRVERMISAELEQAEGVDAFMSAVSQEDEAYTQRVEESRKHGRVLRYMATVKNGQCHVGLRSVPADSPAGSLAGPDNLVVIRSERYMDNPMVIRGPGAGPHVTAAGLFGDLIRAASVK